MYRETFMLNHKIDRHYEIGLQRINHRFFSTIKIDWIEIRSLLIRLNELSKGLFLWLKIFLRGRGTGQGNAFLLKKI